MNSGTTIEATFCFVDIAGYSLACVERFARRPLSYVPAAKQ